MLHLVCGFNLTSRKWFGREMITYYAEILHDMDTKVSKLLDNIDGLKPFPVFEEGKEQAYLNYFKDKHSNLTQWVDELEGHLKQAEQNGSELGIPTTQVLPSVDSAKQAVKEGLSVAALNTRLRILSSKAASNASAILMPSIEKTLDFISGNGLEVPDGIKKRMAETLESLKAAAGGTKSKQRSAAAAPKKKQIQ